VTNSSLVSQCKDQLQKSCINQNHGGQCYMNSNGDVSLRLSTC
jgi:hypothetical protein